MDPRSNSYIIQQLSSRYVPNFPLQYSGNSHAHRPQFFPSSNHDFNLSPPRDRAFNSQVHIRPPAPTLLPPQIPEASYSSNGQLFNPNSRHVSSRMPNFPSNIDCFNYAQRRGEYPLRMQEHDRERHSSSHENRRSNPAWSSKVLDDHRIRFGSREDNRMKVQRFGGSGRVSLSNQNVDIGFSSSSMIKGDYKSEGKRGNIEGSDWVPMKPQTSSRQQQRKSALQRIQKPVYERLEENPVSFNSTPRSEDFEKLPLNCSFSSQPSYLHYSFKAKSSLVDHPDYTKHVSPSKKRARKRIQREYERPLVGKARKHDGSETSLETHITLNRSDMTPRTKGKNLQEYAASENIGNHDVATLFEATEKDELMADDPNSSPSDVRLSQKLVDCISTYVGSPISTPNSSGKLKRLKPSPTSESYAKRSRNNAERSSMEETSSRVLLEKKISCEGSFPADKEGKNAVNGTQVCISPIRESFPESSDLMNNKRTLDSVNLDSLFPIPKDEEISNTVNSESCPRNKIPEVINSNLDLISPDSNENVVDSLCLDKRGEKKLTNNGVALESKSDEMGGVKRTKFDLGSPDSRKNVTLVGEKRNVVENTSNIMDQFVNPQSLYSEAVPYHQELRSPEIAEKNLTSKSVETELNSSNIASTRELPRSFSKSPLHEMVLSPEKSERGKDDESSKACSQNLNLAIKEAVRMILEPEVLQNCFNDETQRGMLNSNDQANENKFGESPNCKNSSEVVQHSPNDETRRIIPTMHHESPVEGISPSVFQETSQVLQNGINDATSFEKIADSAQQNVSSDDFRDEAKKETQTISVRNHQSSVENIAGFASQVCFSEVFQSSVNEKEQRTISNAERRPSEEKAADCAPQRSSLEGFPSSVTDETLKNISNANHHPPTEKTADSAGKIPSSQGHHTPSNSSSLVSSGSLSSSESIPRNNSLSQQMKSSSNSPISEEPQKDNQPSFKKPTSSNYSSKPRTWHRASDTTTLPITNAPPSSYIRKGNSLIRKPNASSSDSFISLGSEDLQEDAPENAKSITYVKPKANQLVASVSDIDPDIIPISTHKKPRKPKKLTRKAARKQPKGTPISKQLVPWKWTSYRRKTLSQSQPTADEDAASAKPKHDFSIRKVKTLSGEHKYIRIGKGNKLVRETNKRTRILANEKIRWSLHTVRSRMSKKKKYCQFYTRFGKCNKNDGKCPYLHDPSKIAVCTKFLSGSCADSRCILTHKVMPERMPDCSYFLQNLCNNSCCPYRHVHVDPGAEPCQAFLKGFCADGDECLMKHSYECPKLAETGSCAMGLRCKFHHPTVKSKGLRNQRFGLSGVPMRYFRVMPMNVSESVGVDKDETLPDFISIDDCDDTAFVSEDDVDDDSIFPLCLMNVLQ